MKIIEIAREQKDALNEGMAWVAIWGIKQKNYRLSWFAEDFHPIEVNDTCPVFEPEQLARLAEITVIDENAILLNGYYHSWVGSSDDPLTAAQIADGIKRHYEMEGGRLSDFLAGEQNEDDEIAETSAEEPTETADSNPVPTGEEVMDDEVDSFTIELPWQSCGDLTRAKETLCKLIESKATLIKVALGEDGLGELPIEFTDNTVKFKWLKLGVQPINPADGKAVTFGTVGDWDSVRKSWTEFLCAAVKFAKKAQRVTAKDSGELPENPKFTMRCLLIKVGLKGAEYKVVRSTILRFLDGDSAFATPESKEKWRSKHLPAKKAEVASE